jgi:hypothetical protein
LRRPVYEKIKPDVVSNNFRQTHLFRQVFKSFSAVYYGSANTGNNILKTVSVNSDLANDLVYFSMTGGRFSTDILCPLLDKRIIEFAARLPPEQFLVRGWPRSIFRRAMEGILPVRIQWRRTKGPFSPDFHRRVLSAKTKVHELLTDRGDDDFVNRYINKSMIFKQLDNIKPCMGWDDWEVDTQRIVVKGVTATLFLRWFIEYAKNRGP